MNVIMERHQYRVFTTGEQIREFSVNYAKLSGKCLVAYDCLLFKHGASFKYSPVTSHLSPATRILSENPAVQNFCGCSSHVILRGKQWLSRKMLAVFSCYTSISAQNPVREKFKVLVCELIRYQIIVSVIWKFFQKGIHLNCGSC